MIANGATTIRFAAIFGVFVLPNELAAQARFIRDVDPMTDADRSRVTINSSGFSASGSVMMSGAMLVVRCAGAADTDVYVATSEFLNSDQGIHTLWRFNDESAESRLMSPSTDGTGAFAYDGDQLPLIAKIRQASRVLIRLEDFRGSQYTYQFSLAGSAAALSRLRCVQVVEEAAEAAAQAAVEAKREEWDAEKVRLLAQPWRQFGRSGLRYTDGDPASIVSALQAAISDSGFTIEETDTDHTCEYGADLGRGVQHSSLFVCAAPADSPREWVVAIAGGTAIPELLRSVDTALRGLRPRLPL